MTAADEFYQEFLQYEQQAREAPRIGFGERSALLIVDMQNTFAAAPSPASCPMAPSVIEHNARLLATARQTGIPRLFARALVMLSQFDAGLRRVKSPAHQPEMSSYLHTEDSWASAFVEQLSPRADEIVIPKRRTSAFWGTPLDLFLRGLGVDTLIITGCYASGCLRHTVFDAFSLDYRILIPRECVMDGSNLSLQVNLCDMGIKFADVIAVDEVIETLLTRASSMPPVVAPIAG